MEIIRKELSPKELQDPNLRYNSGTNQVQQTHDSGATWVNAPNLDYRHNPANALPLRTGTNVQCNSAANMTAKFKSFVDTAIADLNVAKYITDAVALVFTIFVGVDVLIDLVAFAFEGVYSVGAALLTITFTPTVYQHITNILYCDISPDGTVTAAQLARINADILAQLGSTVSLVWNYTMTGLGEIGLQNAGALGSVVGSCSATGCTYGHELDLRANQNDGDIFDPFISSLGQWLSGIGSMAVPNGSQSELFQEFHLLGTSADYLIDAVEFEFEGVWSPGSGNVRLWSKLHDNTISPLLASFTAISGHAVYRYATPATCQYFRLDIYSTVNTLQRPYCTKMRVYWHSGALAPAYTVNI